MSTIEERTAYEKNPYFTGHIYGNFSPFYVTIAICTVILGSIIIINVVLGCWSKHRRYWQDRHTGNRWLVSIWSATPHLQPPLDLTELKSVEYFQRFHPTPQIFHEDIEAQETVPIHQPSAQQLQQQHHHYHQQQQPHQQQPIQQQRPPRPEGRGLQQQRKREEYVELQKRESDI